MDVYTHDSYTLVRATAMMREAVAHLLTREIPEDLARELQSWRRPGKGKGEGHVQEVEGEPIPFQLIKRIHEQLQKMPMGGSLGGHLVGHWVDIWCSRHQTMGGCICCSICQIVVMFGHQWVGVCLLQEHNSLGPSLFPLSPVLIACNVIKNQ